MKFILAVALFGSGLWLLWLLNVTRMRARLRKSDRLRQAAIAAIMHRIGPLLSADIQDISYSVAAEFLQLGLTEGLVGRATTEDEAVQEALNYVGGVLSASPNAIQAVVSRVLPSRQRRGPVRDTVVNDPESPEILRVIEDATSLLEAELAAQRLHAEIAEKSLRLCAAECVRKALAIDPKGPVTTFLLSQAARRVFDDSVRTYGSFANAVSAAAARAESFLKWV